MKIVEMLVELGRKVPRFLVGPMPRLISRLSFTGLVQFLVELGRTSLRYSGGASKSIVSGAGRVLLGMSLAWCAVLLALILAGVL